jgi:hypothetical protein
VLAGVTLVLFQDWKLPGLLRPARSSETPSQRSPS